MNTTTYLPFFPRHTPVLHVLRKISSPLLSFNCLPPADDRHRHYLFQDHAVSSENCFGGAEKYKPTFADGNAVPGRDLGAPSVTSRQMSREMFEADDSISSFVDWDGSVSRIELSENLSPTRW